MRTFNYKRLDSLLDRLLYIAIWLVFWAIFTSIFSLAVWAISVLAGATWGFWSIIGIGSVLALLYWVLRNV